MLGQIRAFAKSPVANVLMAILLISFVIFGVRGATSAVGAQDEVIKAGSRPGITSEVFRDRFMMFKQQLEQQNQQTISMDEAVKADLDREVADELAVGESFAVMMNRIGVRPDDKLVADRLRTIRGLFNPITGAFDKTAYATLLRQNNLTAAQLEGDFRDQIAERQFVSGMSGGLRAPMIYAALEAAYVGEARDFQWFAIEPKVLGPPIKPTDADLNGFIKKNLAQLMKPEMRQLSVVHFSAAALAPTLAIADADLKKRFEFEKDTLSTPEKRTFVQIPVADAKTAAAVRARLAAGVDPTAAAKTIGAQAVVFTDQPRSALPDKAVAAAVFALKEGQVSDLVTGDLGASIVKLIKITPGHEATLEEVRPKIEGEVRKAAAEEKAYQLVQKYDDVHSGGADMAAAAKASGQVVATLPPIMARGVDLQGQPSNLPPKVLTAAFSLPSGGESDPIDLGQGEYYVVHVDKVLPPAPPTLEEIRPKLTQFYILRETARRLQEKAQALSTAVSKGESMADAARSVGASVTEANGVLRNGAGQVYSADLIGKIFQAKPGDVVTGEGVRLSYAVAKLVRIDPSDPAKAAPLAVAQRNQVTRSLFEDLGQDTRTFARAVVKPKVDYARARKALGVDTPASGAVSAGAPGKAPAGAPAP